MSQLQNAAKKLAEAAVLVAMNQLDDATILIAQATAIISSPESIQETIKEAPKPPDVSHLFIGCPVKVINHESCKPEFHGRKGGVIDMDDESGLVGVRLLPLEGESAADARKMRYLIHPAALQPIN